MPTSMPRSGNNLPTGELIDIVYSKKINAVYYKRTFLMEIFNTNWEGEIKTHGSKVVIPVRPTVQITKNSAIDDPVTYQDLLDDSVELSIDRLHRFAVKVPAVYAKQSFIDIINQVSTDAAERMRVAVQETVLGSIYSEAGTSMTSTIVTKVNVLDWLTDATVALEEKNIPDDGRRWAVIPPWIGGMVLKSDFKDASLSGDDTSIGKKGVGFIGKWAGLDLYVTNTVATNGTTWHCMAGHPDSVAYASQINSVKTLTLQDYYADAVRGECNFGFKANLPDGLVYMPATKN